MSKCTKALNRNSDLGLSVKTTIGNLNQESFHAHFNEPDHSGMEDRNFILTDKD